MGSVFLADLNIKVLAVLVEIEVGLALAFSSFLALLLLFRPVPQLIQCRFKK